jgi:hypothetical protein
MKVLLVLLATALVASCVQIELPVGQEKCIHEDFNRDVLIKGTVKISPNYPDMQLSFKVIFFLF